MMAKKSGMSAAGATARPNPKVDGRLRVAKAWADEMKALRAIAFEFPLDEDLKWRWPCYSLEGSNIVLIHAFKEYCAVLFFKGALLKDAKGILKSPGQTQAGRQMRFSSLSQISGMKPVLKAYIREAIEVEKAGLKVPMKKTSDFAVPQEFQDKLKKNPALKAAFEALTPGRQRGYLFYFSGAKQSKTREERVEKCAPKILKGKGLDD
jgi:uncharacterized protein YdeI (YjbR/CyaY-like superfamily)